MISRLIHQLSAINGMQRTYKQLKFRIKKENYKKQESRGNRGSEIFSHVTYYAVSNAGDTVLSQCVRKTIQTKAKVSSWNLIPVNQEVTENTIDRINNCQKLIIGGGGLFLPDSNKNKVSGWQWAISNDQLKQISIPIYVYSVGYNYFRGQEASSLFRESLCALVEKSSFFGLRNMGSVNAIKELVPENMALKIQYQPCTTTLIRKLYNDILPSKGTTGNVAINMAFDREELRYGAYKESILSQVASAIKRIQEKGYTIYYVCHCWDDDKFIPYLNEQAVKYKFVDLSDRFPEDVIRFYNSMDIVLGMRGHAQMIPFGLNCEIISLGTHDKMKWFLNDIDAQDWYIDLREDIPSLSDKLFYKFVEVHERDAEKTTRRIKSKQELLWNITCNNLKDFKALHG